MESVEECFRRSVGNNVEEEIETGLPVERNVGEFLSVKPIGGFWSVVVREFKLATI